MQRLVDGRNDALDALMERHATKLFGFLCRMLDNEEDASDLAQETFARVYLHRKSFDPRQSFSAWMYTIAANLARNHYRWRSRHPAVSLDAPLKDNDLPGEQGLRDLLPSSGAAPDQEALEQERALAVRNAVQNLPEEMREAILLCEWEDLSMAEAARILKTTVKAVESRLYRARKLLKASLCRWI